MANHILPKRGTNANIIAKLANIKAYEIVYNTTNKTLGIKDTGAMQWAANESEVVKLTGDQSISGTKTIDNVNSSILSFRIHTESSSNTGAELAGIGFGVDTTNKYMKSAIAHRRLAANGKGELNFYISDSDGGNNVTTSDLALTINSNKNIDAVGEISADKLFEGPDRVALLKDLPDNTLDTAGSLEELNKKLYLIGAAEQLANSITVSNSKVYIGTDNSLYSNDFRVYAQDSNLIGRKSLNIPNLVNKEYLGDGWYLLRDNAQVYSRYNVYTGYFNAIKKSAAGSAHWILNDIIPSLDSNSIYTSQILNYTGTTIPSINGSGNPLIHQINNFTNVVLSELGEATFQLQIEEGTEATTYQVPIDPILYHYNTQNIKTLGNLSLIGSGELTPSAIRAMLTVEYNAQANLIEEIKVNGTTLPISDKVVDIDVPTKISELDDDKNLVSYNDMTSYNPFGGKYLYTNFLNNAFYAFDKRYYVTVTTHLKSYGGSTYPKKLTGLPLTDYQWEDSPVVSTLPAAALFDGNYENNIRIPAGHYGKISIKFNDAGTANFLNYPYGTYYMSFYHQSVPEEVKVRTYNNYAAHTIGWKEGTFTYLVGDANSTGNVVVQHTDTGNYQRSKIEFIVVAKDTVKCQPTDLDWKLNRPGVKDTAIISKMHNSTLFTTVNWKEKETSSATVSINHTGINMGSTRITNVGTPINDYDGIHKKYMDDGLASKVDKNYDITANTKTKITYDKKGLVIAGANATLDDIADGTNRKWANKANESEVVKLTGDQDNIDGLKTFKKKVTIEEELAFKNNAYIEYDSGSKSIKFRFG